MTFDEQNIALRIQWSFKWVEQICSPSLKPFAAKLNLRWREANMEIFFDPLCHAKMAVWVSSTIKRQKLKCSYRLNRPFKLQIHPNLQCTTSLLYIETTPKASNLGVFIPKIFTHSLFVNELLQQLSLKWFFTVALKPPSSLLELSC